MRRFATVAEVGPVNINPRDRLIVALDLPSVAAAEKVVAQLGDTVTFYKSVISSPLRRG